MTSRRLPLLVFASAVVLGDSSALGAPPTKGPRRVYISVDMEGISGVSGPDQLSASGPQYEKARQLMARDTNAAIRGAIDGGADEVLVNDAHGSHRNLVLDDLHPRARLLTHSFKPYGMMQGLDDTFDAVMFVGYHAKAGTSEAMFAHTGSGVIGDVQVDGRSLGEGGLNALLAAWHGVPVVLVTGDQAAVSEVSGLAPGCRGVVVKRAINARASELFSLTAASAEIEAAARSAFARARKITPQRPSPLQIRITYKDSLIPDILEAFPSVRRHDRLAVEFTAPTVPDAYRLVRVFYKWIVPVD